MYGKLFRGRGVNWPYSFPEDNILMSQTGSLKVKKDHKTTCRRGGRSIDRQTDKLCRHTNKHLYFILDRQTDRQTGKKMCCCLLAMFVGGGVLRYDSNGVSGLSCRFLSVAIDLWRNLDLLMVTFDFFTFKTQKFIAAKLYQFSFYRCIQLPLGHVIKQI